MKKSNHFAIRTIKRYAYLLVFSILLIACTNSTTKEKPDTTEKEVAKVEDIIWKVKAIHPDGKALDIKAIDKEGNLFDINAIQDSDQDSFLNIKAFVNGNELPVKMLISKDKYAPVKAIDRGGVILDIKAITPEGEKLDVKGIVRAGNVVSIKAINKEGEFYGVKAISPSGQLNDVKGIKINIKEKEMTLNGFSVYAHIKAMHQSVGEGNDEIVVKKKRKGKKEKEFKNIIWNIKAITLDGENIDVKAIDAEGNKFDVKAIQDSKQHSFMNIKAFVNGSELPIKVLLSEDEYAPIKAIDKDGNLYDIKAITAEGTILDVKGVSRSGTIIHVKAINENGEFYGVKALSPDGKLDDVKGIKIFDREKEMTIRGNSIYAHVKAITH